MDTTKIRQRGFTLLEVMIVTAVIAILALVLVPNFSNARDQAATATCESNLQEIATAAELYYADVQQYPGNGTQVDVTAATFTGPTSSVAYLGSTPIDPAAAVTAVYTFQYTLPSGGGTGSYLIKCPGTHPASTLGKLLGFTSSSSQIEYESGKGLETH